MLKTKIKASAITNLTDARYFAAWDVEWMGFSLDPASDHFVDPNTVHAIKDWVEGPQITGEFNLQSAADIQSLVDNLNLDAIQVGPFTPVETLMDLDTQVPVIKEIIFEASKQASDIETILEAHAAHCAYFLFNFDSNGLALTNLPVPLPWLKEVCAEYPILLSIADLNDQLDTILDDIQPTGLSVRGGEEEKVGYKSFDELDDLFEALETLE